MRGLEYQPRNEQNRSFSLVIKAFQAGNKQLLIKRRQRNRQLNLTPNNSNKTEHLSDSYHIISVYPKTTISSLALALPLACFNKKSHTSFFQLEKHLLQLPLAHLFTFFVSFLLLGLFLAHLLILVLCWSDAL
ncbi:unnamed protein product (mitochondrion) [Musa textilis]